MRKNYPDTLRNSFLFFVFLLFLFVKSAFGQTCTDYTVNPSTNIPDGDLNYTIVNQVVADNFTLTDVNVLVDITHPWNSDVDMFLRHPDGTFVELFTDVGGDGNNYSNVTFDDEAAVTVPGGSVNLSGAYQPEGDLSTLDGKSSLGTWSLYIRDDAGGDLGVLNTFTLNLCQATVVVDPCTAGAIVGTPTANDPDGDGINNECDLDDDNDGITDTEEYCTNATTALFPSADVGGDRQVTVTHTDTGFARLDITELDNSFQMTVNGTPVHPSILEFENFALGTGEVYFVFQSDNTFISAPWNPNVNGLPRIRLIIDQSGSITILGTRSTTSTTLETMVAQDGTPFNTITWTPLATNTFVIINQVGPGPEELQGSLLASNICDTDGDGISNELDLDSDNDGIYDIVESGVLGVGGVTDADNDGRIDGASAGGGANGLFNAIETNDTFAANLNYTVVDSDGDGETNPFEVDSDADGCFDAIEAAGSFVAADLTSGRLCTSSACVNANGVPTNAGSPQATATAVTIGDVISSIPITPSPASVCEGSNITLTAAPVGLRNGASAIPAADYIYSWYLGASTTPLSNSAPYSGTTTASLTITNATTGLSGNSYRVEVTTINNSCLEQDNIAITVQALPASAGTNGTLEVCPGNTPTNAQLFAALGGSPAGGGTWSNVGLVYTYRQSATSPCTTDNTATVTVTEIDTTNPTISACPSAVSVNVDAGLCTASSVSLGTAPTGTDNCGTPTITNNAPATFPIGDTTVTWTSTDAAGNIATCTQVVTVVDNINPTISACPSAVSVNVDAGLCTASSVSLGTAPTGTDNCGTPTITNNAPATFPIGDTTVTWTSTDAAGNIATCTQVVTVVDNINPTISACPSAVSVNVDAGLCTASSVSLGTAPTGTDNCGTPTITNNAPATFPIGDTTVTWTSTDAAGNIATCTQVVTVVDNINPTISACPSAVSVNVDAGLCTASSVSLGTAPTGTDNCGTPTITNNAPATFPIGDTTVTWTSTDAAGNIATCTQVVTVVDNINPTISACPSAVSVNVDAGLCTASSVSLGTAPTGTDNCGTPTITNNAPATFPIGDTTVTWTSTDAAGNIATCTQVVTVVDNINPTISACPSAVSVNVDAGLCTASSVSLGTAPTGTDNCGTPTITNNAPATFPIGDTTVTWTSTDAAGNIATCTQVVTVVDNINPTISACPSAVSVNVDAGLCTASSVSLGTAPTGTDNCGTPTITNNAPATFPIGDTTVTWTSTDAAGNIATCTQVVTVVDNINPTISACPSAVSVNVDAGLCTASSVSLGTAPTGTDNCGTPTITNNAPATFPIGDTTVTWTSTDAAGNIATCTQVVTVVDNINPTISACPSAVSVNVDAGLCTASSVSLGTAPTGTDNCGTPTITNNAPATFPIGDTTVTWTSTDAAGNIATCTQVVTVVDNINPTISACPSAVSVNVDAGLCTASSVSLGTAPTGTDNCGTPTITNNAPATFPIGDTTVTWTSTDAAGNIATCTQVVTVVDNINPTISACPSAVSVNVDAGLCTASSVSLGTAPTGTDNCGTPTITNNAPATFPIGDTTVTWTSTDAAGNIATCTQVVTVVDNINPTISACPSAVSVNVDAGLCTASSVSLGTAPTGTDNCGTPTITNNAPATFPIGDTTVTWTSTDAAGNIATCTQVVTVVDNINPTISACPSAVSVNVDAGLCTASSVSLGTAPTGTDNCGTPTITNNAPATFPIGDTTVTWTSTDAAGNIATCTQVVTVVDNINPTISACPSAVSVNVDAGLCTASSVSLGTAPTGTDNCGTPTITNNAPATFPIGDTTVTWTSTDAAGNIATCTQVVTVVDNINPTISACPSAVSVNVDAGLCTASSVSLGTAPTGTDNCGTPTITNNAPATFPIGDTTVTWTSTDAAGNIATCTQVVTVVDNINPTISACPSAVSVNVDAGLCTASSVSLGTAPTGTDNCGTPTITNNAPATFPIGDTTVTWTSTDAAGNIATCTQVVTVVDNINPTISACPSAVSVNVDAGLCTASSVSLGTAPTGTDNCGTPTITNNAPATFPIGDTTVTWTSTDAAGNIATCTQVVTVVDNINPTISACPSAVSVNVDAGLCTASSVSLGTAPTGTDNCGTPTITNNAPATFPIGDTTVTWTSTDAAGNIATCTQVVTVVDNINPTISACPSAVSVNVDAGLCTASSVSLGTAPTGTDNCGTPTITNNAPATFPIGDTTVTWTSTDAAGNIATCTQVVTVVDNINPTISACPSAVSVNVDAGLCTASSVSLGTAPTGTDNCGTPTITNNAPATFPIGDTTVTWTSTDAAGNIATCTQVVTVVDNINPTISACPSAVSVNVDAGLCTASSVSLGTAPTGTDNCGTPTITNNAPATFPIGDTTVTWTSTDAAGNIATCTQVVTVVDNINPTISACPSAVSVNVDAGLCTASSVSLGTAPTGTDNCGTPTITNNAPATFPIGDTTVTWTSTDAAGNIATCTQVVTVVDNINPTISACPSAVSVNVDAGLCTASSVSLGTAPTGTDNCGTPTITNNAPATFPIGDTTVTWTSTDAAGNIATCTQVVTVVDNINPTISACPSAVSVNVDAGLCTASSVSLGTAPTGTDNCGTPTITNNAPATFPIGDTTVTWTSTDAAGNIATCTQVVTVVDNINPTISACPSAVSVNASLGCSIALVDISLGNIIATDNCTASGSLSISNNAPAVFPIGNTTVVWTVIDLSGNVITCNQIVTVNCIDTDGDGIPDATDVDDDNDGIPDTAEGTVDTDGDGIIDSLDLDSDNDGILDVDEGGNGSLDVNDDGVIDANDGASGIDANGDGQADGSVDSNEEPDTDGDGVPDYKDLDSDNDGINDVIENGNGSLDTNEDGIIDSNDTGGNDLDGDGISDSIDGDTSGFGEGISGEGDTVDTDGDGVPDYQDLDSDDDGINDVVEGGNSDVDGDGQIDNPNDDTDGDGIPDSVDGLDGHGDANDPDHVSDPIDPNSGGNGVVGDSGTDTDGDGIADSVDGLNGFGDAIDTDGDGISDAIDLDDDNDGIPDTAEGTGDTDGDGIIDSLDLDSDNDGILDVDEGGNGSLDVNGDGVIDANDGASGIDANGDGQADGSVDSNEEPDTDGDGVPDYKDLDSDNDGINDVIENGNGSLDTNEDGVIDSNDSGGLDSDGDGISDSIDGDTSGFGEGTSGEGDTIDTDGDGVPDYQDLDSDDDGTNDVVEGGNSDIDGDGQVDNPMDDTDGDGIADSVDGLDGHGDANDPDNDSDSTDPDSGGNGVVTDSGTDTDGDGIADSVDGLDGFGDAYKDDCIKDENYIMTPNGDNLNNYLHIECIDNPEYINNTLEIFNRWGNVVYKVKGYSNVDSTKRFEGISNGRATISIDDKLPVGTYFYKLNLGNGTPIRKGWVYINR